MQLPSSWTVKKQTVKMRNGLWWLRPTLTLCRSWEFLTKKNFPDAFVPSNYKITNELMNYQVVWDTLMFHSEGDDGGSQHL